MDKDSINSTQLQLHYSKVFEFSFTYVEVNKESHLRIDFLV